MLSCNADHDAFTWDGLVNIPDLDSPTTWPNVHVVDLQSLTTGLLALVEEQIVKTKLPALSTSFFKLATDDVALPSLDHSGDSANASDHEEQDAAKQSQHTEPDADSLEELWMLPDIVAPQRKPVLTSWDHFHNEDHIDPRPHYLSELGALTFNAALNKYVGTRPTKEVIFEPFLYGLIELGLGRESVFFAWDEKQNKMMRREEIEQYKVTDFSEISIQSVIEDMLGIGTIYRTLKHRHSQIDRRSKGFATWQALNAAIGSVLAGIERHMEIVRGDAVSILQIQSSFARPGQLLKAVSDLVNEFLDSGQNVARTLVAAFKVAEDVSERSSWLQNIVQKFVQNVSLPLLRGVGEELLGNCACGLGEPSRPHCQVLIESALLSQESKDLLRKTLDNLDMLSSLPDTSSASRQPISDGHESLSYEYSTAGFDILHGKAKRLEQSLIDAIVICRQDTKAFSAHDEQGPLDMWDRGLELINPWLLDLDLSSPLGPNKHDSGLATEDVLTETVCQDIGCIQPPSHLNIDFPLQHMESSILPFVLARYRATTYSLLSSIMQQDHLAEHLTLNLKYQLFGNPFFAKRISTALFDAAQTSSEGRRKVAGSGLRLQARDKWPPTSSEVRVALMHVLSESFLVSKEQVSYSKITNNMDKLDETISFAIRDLTDTELEACRDVNSIHALDFLSIQYKPSSPLLEIIFAAPVLKKYDRASKFLLRLLRMQNIAQEITRSNLDRSRGDRPSDVGELKLAIRHFIETLADHAQNTAMGMIFSKLTTRVAELKTAFSRYDPDGVLATRASIQDLASTHDDSLSDLTAALFLSKRQSQVAAIIDSIFTTILHFSAHLRRNADDDSTITRLHDQFKKDTKRFVRYLRSQSTMDTSRTGTDESASRYALLCEMLEVRLNLNEWYG